LKREGCETGAVVQKKKHPKAGIGKGDDSAGGVNVQLAPDARPGALKGGEGPSFAEVGVKTYLGGAVGERVTDGRSASVFVSALSHDVVGKGRCAGRGNGRERGGL